MKEFIDKLIERLEDLKHKSKQTWNDYHLKEDFGRVHAFQETIKIVNQLAEEYNNGWIPVSSGRLPEESVPVEVTVREENDNGGYDLYVFESWYQEGRWAIGKTRYNPTVIAWKPKDAPYQPKGE